MATSPKQPEPEVTEYQKQAAREVLHYFGDSRGWEPGGFTYNLMRAYCSADRTNRARLRPAFPELTEALDIAIDQDGGIELLAARSN